ncbi:four helix bundle protein [Cytobacillus horneckiae]|uniref:four helix bundle protein n=1 Tax=Cytobacillus horneckiae TaxID=549687 RepID=UPI002DB86EDE|nr:four helix bundle protein [Cytobacillus horneckiae]MEC1157821.1 four helix bundle protein [Cytobacillus horneckiae]MED2940715.1 four helix bundle protein [Cytobacillus horneckiae]
MGALKKQYSGAPKKLILYEKCINFAKEMFEISEEFPDGIVRDLIKKSAAAILTNTAESRATMYYAKEFSHLNVAIGGISQIKSLIEIALVRSFITFGQYNQIDSDATELLKMSFSLIKRFKENVGNAEVNKWRIDDFQQSNLYNRSIDLMQSIYYLVDCIEFDISLKEADKAYKIAVNTPLLIASGIGQFNMKVRINKFNQVQENLRGLKILVERFQDLSYEHRAYLNNIEECRIQVVKLLNNYFGRLTSSNKVEQAK